MLFALILLLIGIDISAQDTEGQTDVRFAIGEWAPFTSVALSERGMAAEIVSAACSAVGLKAKYVFYPWKRAESEVSDGAYFGTFPYQQIREREGLFLFSEPLFSSSFVVVLNRRNAKTNGFKFSGAEAFKDYSVGIVAGTDAIRIPLERAGARVEVVQNADQNLRKLLAGRIDFYIDDKAVVAAGLRKGFTQDKSAELLFLDQDFGEKNDFRIMVSLKYPNSKDLLDKVNEGLRRIRQSGEWNRISGNYGL